ncbi:MAG: flagellar M-ring protein FliF [Betaproteobacteria bacterium]|nr:flagellar M-ring protein FliF [Betaproteobacteria bacterium]
MNNAIASSPAGGFLGRIPPRSLMALLVGAATLIAVSAAAVMWLRTPDYKLLFANVSDKDGGAVVAALGQLDVPFRNGEGGAIYVPADRVHDIRLKLASQGLPKGGGVGLELMDGQKFGATQFQEQVNFQRGLEGEIARSIQSLSAVQSARVHLALPKASLFVRDAQKPSASIVLNLYPGKSLERSQVAGITHLVASSVADMPLAGVSIVDQHGNLLSAPPRAPGSAAGLNPSELAYVQEIEQGHIKRILDILEPIAGRGNVRAQVTAEVDFSQVEQTAELYKPNQGSEPATVRSTSSSESASGSGGGASGVPGALTNQPPSAGEKKDASASAASSNTRKESVVNYEVDKTVRHTRAQVGSVKRLSAAILVNHKRPAPVAAPAADAKADPKDAKPAAAPVPVAFTEAEVGQMNALVKEAIGFNKDRGDSLNLVNAPFSTEPESIATETPIWQRPEAMSFAKEGGKALFLLAALAFVVLGIIRPAMRQVAASMAASAERDASPAPAALAGASTLSALPGAAPSALADVQRIARDDPATVANVVRTWVAKPN